MHSSDINTNLKMKLSEREVSVQEFQIFDCLFICILGHDKPPSNLVDLLVESNLYDMAFTVILRFWQHCGLKRYFLILDFWLSNFSVIKCLLGSI